MYLARAPDNLLIKLSELVDPEKTVSASVTFVDIAGLVKGASEGEGLGNQFLAQIREVDAIIHVVRGFTDPSVPATYGQGLDAIELVNIELELGGIKGVPTLYVYNCDEGNVRSDETDKILSEIKRIDCRVIQFSNA